MKNRIHVKPLLFVMGAVFILFFYKCPFRYIWGVPCPGCGMTRALYALLRLRFIEAWNYHPLVYLVFPAVIIMMLRITGRYHFDKQIRNVLLWITAIIFIAVYIMRICAGDGILYINLSEGLVWRMVHGITTWVQSVLM